MAAMMHTKKDRLLKNNTHIYANRIHEEPTNLPFCHRHDFFTIEHIIDGECIQYINGKEYVCKPGSVCMLSPFDEHKYCIADHAVIDYICFGDDAVFPEVWELLDVDKAPYIARFSAEVFQDFISEFSILQQELSSCKPLYGINAKSIVNRMIITILRISSENDDEIHPKKSDLREAISYIRYHFREPLTLEGVASMFHVTPSHFCKYFKKNTFYTFKEYLIALRLDYAMRLLKTTDKTISEVCFESGFSSPSYFSKLFIRRFGKSPSQCR